MKQHKEKMAEQARQHVEQIAVLIEQVKTKENEMKNLRKAACDGDRVSYMSMARFHPFNSSSELWLDHLKKFRTFLTANSTPKEKKAQVLPLSSRLQ